MKPLTVADVSTWTLRTLRNGSSLWCRYCHTAINPKEQYRAKYSGVYVHERCLATMRIGAVGPQPAAEILAEILHGKLYE